jgi:excisionase family DNA binding protein
MTSKPLINKKELAQRLGLSVRGVECLMARKALPFYRLGHRTVRFDEREVGQALEEMKVEAVRRRGRKVVSARPIFPYFMGDSPVRDRR